MKGVRDGLREEVGNNNRRYLFSEMSNRNSLIVWKGIVGNNERTQRPVLKLAISMQNN